MKNFPALCPACGIAFGVPNLIGGSGVANISFIGSTTRCPRCSSRANILDGEYRWERETVDLVSGPPVTMEVFRKLKELLLKPINPEEALSEIESVAPNVAETLRRLVAKHGLPVVLVVWLLKTLIEHIDFSVNLDAKIDLNRALEQVYERNLKKIESGPAKEPQDEK